jgi:SNF2 family DNA or RNA helicase
MLLEDIRQHVQLSSDVKWYGSSIKFLFASMFDCFSLLTNTTSVVFSAWRMTLDLVEAGLRQAGMSCLRFDGKVPQKDRQGVVERFQTDPSVKVLLLTLSCGAIG